MIEEKTAVRIEKNGDGITWLYMNRPEKRNAMNPTMHREMLESLEALEQDDDTRVVVLTGAGNAFSAGQDLREYFRELDDRPKERVKVHRSSHQWRFERLYHFPKITIAMVNGWCCGGAFTQLFACDFAIAADEAQFSLSEVNWGILPGGNVTKVVADCLGYRDALYYILTADVFTGREASAMRLINYSVPADRLREETETLAKKLMQKNPQTLRFAKEAYRAVRTMDYDQAEDYLAAKSAQLKASDPEDGRSRGMTEFLDRKSYRPGLQPYPR